MDRIATESFVAALTVGAAGRIRNDLQGIRAEMRDWAGVDIVARDQGLIFALKMVDDSHKIQGRFLVWWRCFCHQVVWLKIPP